MPSSDFSNYLAGYGQVFTPVDPPPGAADWHAAVRGQPFPGGTVEKAMYGTVSCVDPSKNCATRGLARPGQPIAIWYIGFADSPAAPGCDLWATVDAHSGDFINGNGPPC